MLVKTATDWSADNCQQKGAALAYYTIFSLAPLLLISMALAGMVVGNGASHDFVMARIQTMIGRESAGIIDDLLLNISRPMASKAASAVGVLVLLLGASGVVGELQSSLNQIWKSPPRESSLATRLEARLLALSFVLALGFLLVVSLILSAIVAALGKYLAEMMTLPPFVLQAMNLAVFFALITLLFAMIYKVLPEARIAWHDVWAGATATAFLFAVGNSFLGLYIGKFSGASAFGAAGSVVLILFWTYYCAQILYLGAEFTHVYAETRQEQKKLPAS
jgi:membrane protein